MKDKEKEKNKEKNKKSLCVQTWNAFPLTTQFIYLPTKLRIIYDFLFFKVEIQLTFLFFIVMAFLNPYSFFFSFSIPTLFISIQPSTTNFFLLQ